MMRVRLLRIRCARKKESVQIRVPGHIHEFTCPLCGKTERIKQIRVDLPEHDTDPKREIPADHTFVL